MDTRAALPTVSVAEPEIEPEVAVMVAVPTPALVASPLLPESLLTTATAATVDAQVAVLVMFWVVPSV